MCVSDRVQLDKVRGEVLRTYSSLSSLESRINSRRDDPRSRYNLSRQVPIDTQDDVTRELSRRDHVGRFLEFDRLLVDESTLVVDDHVRVEGTIFRFSTGSSSTDISERLQLYSHKL